MTQPFTQVHDEIIETYVPTCRFCKKTADEHADGVCLFDATLFTPMSPEEWTQWRRQVWLEVAKTGAQFIREELKQSGFAREILGAKPKGTPLKMHGPTYTRPADSLIWVPPPPPEDYEKELAVWQSYEMVKADITPRICRNCEKERDTHVDGQCLFEASSFEPMSMEELMKWATTSLNHAAGFSMGTVTGRMSCREPNISTEYLGKWPSDDEDSL